MQRATLSGLCCVIAVLALTSFAKANLLLYEPFNYTSGQNLVGQTDTAYPTNPVWVQTGSVGTGPVITSTGLSPTGSYPGYPATTGLAADTKTTDSIVPRITLGTTIGSASGTVYYSLLVKLGAVNITNGTAGAFFAGFNNTVGSQSSAATVFGAELAVHANGTAGYNFGIFNGGNTRVFDTKTYGTADTVLIVASYTFNSGSNDDVAKLWVNPADSMLDNGTSDGDITVTPDVTATGDMTSTASSNFIRTFFLRDNASQATGGVNVDEVRVWTVPEPTSLAILSLTTAAIMRRRRRTS